MLACGDRRPFDVDVLVGSTYRRLPFSRRILSHDRTEPMIPTRDAAVRHGRHHSAPADVAAVALALRSSRPVASAVAGFVSGIARHCRWRRTWTCSPGVALAQRRGRFNSCDDMIW